MSDLFCIASLAAFDKKYFDRSEAAAFLQVAFALTDDNGIIPGKIDDR